MIVGRQVLATCSVALFLVVTGVAIAFAPDGAQGWLLIAGLAAGVTAIQSVASDPRDLAPALVFSLFPVLSLLTPGSPAWLVGPLAALLVVAAELSVLSWAWQGGRPPPPLRRRRLVEVAWLGALGLAGGLAVGVIRFGPLPGGALVALVATAALVGVGHVIFSRRSPGRVS